MAQIKMLEERLAVEEQEAAIGAVARCQELTRQKAEVEKERPMVQIFGVLWIFFYFFW